MTERPDDKPPLDATRRKGGGPGAWLVAAIAAGLLVLAVAVATGFGHISLPFYEAVTPRSAINAALDSLPSGETARNVRPLHTLTAADGRPCRVFRVERKDPRQGLACREKGAWNHLAMGPARPEGAGEPEEVAAALKTLRPGAPLSPDEERARIAAGWE